MKSYTFRTIIEPEKPRGYHGFVPILKGLHTYGKTLPEVQKNLKEAIVCHVQGLMKDGVEVPLEEETFESIQSFSIKELASA
jgi:predicted RNase H-like HicB family nuclease